MNRFFLVSILSLLLSACAPSTQIATPTPKPELELTITAMPWEQKVDIWRSDKVRIDEGWQYPEEANVISVEKRVDSFVFPPEIKDWYTYEVQEDRPSRLLYSSGLGKDPAPYYQEYELLPGEFVRHQCGLYIIQLEDNEGNNWMWGPTDIIGYGPERWVGRCSEYEDLYDEFMQFQVGMTVISTSYYSDTSAYGLVYEMTPAQ